MKPQKPITSKRNEANFIRQKKNANKLDDETSFELQMIGNLPPREFVK